MFSPEFRPDLDCVNEQEKLIFIIVQFADRTFELYTAGGMGYKVHMEWRIFSVTQPTSLSWKTFAFCVDLIKSSNTWTKYVQIKFVFCFSLLIGMFM